jgi:hypothetical protein
LEEHGTSISWTEEYAKQETRMKPAASRAETLFDSDCITQRYILKEKTSLWKLH